MGLTRRRLVAMAAGAAGSSAPAGRSAAATSITVAALGGVFQQAFQAGVIDAFRRVRPDIAVYYYAVSNPAQILGLLRQRQEPPQFDVVMLTPKTARQATSETLLAPMPPESMPVLSQLIPAATIEGVAGAVAMIDCLAMPHVPEATKQDITSWRILWDPTVARRITMPPPPDPIGIGFTLIASHLFARGIDRQSLAGGINAIRHIAPRVVNWTPRPNVYDVLIDGNAAFGVAWNGIGQVRAQRNPGRLRMAMPADAWVHELHTIHLVRRSPRLDAAGAFAAFVLSTEGQGRIADSLFMTPVNPGARIDPANRGRLVPTAALADDRTTPLLVIDSPDIEALRGLIVSGWRDQILRGL
jgi:putative spermidine/putrescine transport system substrate-binding protein